MWYSMTHLMWIRDLDELLPGCQVARWPDCQFTSLNSMPPGLLCVGVLLPHPFPGTWNKKKARKQENIILALGI